MSVNVNLTKPQLAALDLLIAAMEENHIHSVRVSPSDDVAGVVLCVVHVIAGIIDFAAEGVAAQGSTAPLREAAEGLPKHVSLERLIEARKMATAK